MQTLSRTAGVQRRNAGGVTASPRFNEGPLQERACLRRRCVCAVDLGWDTGFASKPAPTGFAVGLEMSADANLGFTRKCRLTPNRCRSALAREGVVSVPGISAEIPRSPASRLLQVRRLAWEMSADANLGFTRKCRLTPNRCRSALAREGGVSVPGNWAETPRSPASRLLQVLRLAWKCRRTQIWGLPGNVG